MLFRIDPDGKAAEAVPASTFSELPYHERYDIQEWVLQNPELLGEPLLVITSEFSGFDRTSERLDVLALSREGKLVVVELKRTATGTTAELQALRYAAYCSTLELDDVVDLCVAFRNRRGGEVTADEVRSEIQEFVDEPGFEELDDQPRIILAADDFGPEVTATVLWLRSFEVDVRCVRLTPYSVSGALVVDSTVLIPLPEAAEFVVRRERKDASRASRSRKGRPTLEEYLAGIPDDVRPWFDKLRSALMADPGVRETVYGTLVSYRQKSDNAWISWLAHTKTQARFALPDDHEFPEEMVVTSRDGWTRLSVKSDEDVAVGVELLRKRVDRVREEGGSSVLGG
jgi:hypothetical protein